jgi:uncharacterized membrane protein
MAGIGFQLTKLMAKRTFAGGLQAYGFAALIGSGPWVLSMVTLALLGLATGRVDAAAGLDLFFVAVTHIFGFSLIVTGPLQLLLSRFAADAVYTRREEDVFPSFLGGLVVALAANAALGFAFFGGLVPAPPLFRLAATGVLMTVSAIWIGAVYLSAVRDYTAVVRCFAIGYAVSFAAGWALTVQLGVAGTMAGFLAGQLVLLLSMIRIVYREYGAIAAPSFAFFGYFRKHTSLALCGLVYNLGIWIDKPLHWWFSPHRYQVAGALWASPLYDEAVFLSFLSVAPGMAVFLLTVETTFAERYAEFFRLVVAKGRLAEILQTKEEMIAALRDGLARLLKFQGAVTLALVLGAEPLLRSLGLGAVQTLVFQVTLVGVCLLVLFLALLTVLFYLDRLRDALASCIVFAVVNAGLTVVSLGADERWYGLGFTVAAAVGAVVAGAFANRALRRLEFETFTSQPVYGSST